LNTDELLILDLNTFTWKSAQYAGDDKAIPQKRTDHSMVHYAKNLYIFGGKGEKKNILNDLRRYSIETNHWTQIKGEGALIEKRFGHSGISYGSSM
jgi:N-acetylneuraminic acid mutarotase